MITTMKLLGFNLTKIEAYKSETFVNSNIVSNIEFTDFQKQNLPMLKEGEGIKVSFKHDLVYNSKNEKKQEKQGNITFEGSLLLSADEEESKKLLKAWKKQEFTTDIRIPLSNLILRKCTPKTIQLQEELNLPTHIPMPLISPPKKQN